MKSVLANMGTLRGISDSLSTREVEVLRRERVSDGEGGFVTEDVVAATYPGRYRTASSTELRLAEQMAQSVTGVITLPFDASVENSDRLRIGETVYHVSGVLDKTPELSARLQVLVRQA